MKRIILFFLISSFILEYCPVANASKNSGHATIYMRQEPRVCPIEVELRRPPKKDFFDLFFEEELRANLIGFHLLKYIPAATSYPALPFCYTPLTPIIQEYYKTKDFRGVMVVGQIPGTLDKHLGLERGDEILSVDGERIFLFAQLRKLILSKRGKSEVEIELRRQDKVWKQKVPLLQVGIPMPFLMQRGKRDVDAFVTGSGNVWLSNGLLDFVDNDDQLALVIGHEMAHWVNGDYQKTINNNTLSAAVGLAVGAVAEYYCEGSGLLAAEKTAMLARTPFSREMEYKADEQGLRYIVKAGFSAQEAYTIWKKFENYIPPPDELFILNTHPAYPDRLERLKALAESMKRSDAAVVQPGVTGMGGSNIEGHSSNEN